MSDRDFNIKFYASHTGLNQIIECEIGKEAMMSDSKAIKLKLDNNNLAKVFCSMCGEYQIIFKIPEEIQYIYLKEKQKCPLCKLSNSLVLQSRDQVNLEGKPEGK